MTRINQDIPNSGDERYVAGDSCVIEVTVRDGDGNVMNLTDVDVAFAVADYPGATTRIEKTSVDNDVSVVDAVNGTVEVTIHPSDTEHLGAPRGEPYHYEISIRDTSDNEAVVTTGEWTIYDDTASLP